MLVVCPHCATLNLVPENRLQDDPVCGQCGKALLPSEPVELTDATFDRFVAKSELPVLVDFWAPWCGPCKMIAPVLEEIAKEKDGALKVAKLDVDDNPETAQKFGVMSIPTLLLFKDGREVNRLVGYMPKNQLLQKIAQTV